MATRVGPVLMGVLASTMFLPTSRTAVAQVFLGASIWDQSPDGKLVCVNGGIGCNGDARTMGWYYEWGDGVTTAGFFPAYHRYEGPGVYAIRVAGFDDQGNSKSVSFTHVVPAPPSGTAVQDVRLSGYFLGLRPGEPDGVTIAAYDCDGRPLSLDAHRVQTFVCNGDSVSKAIDGAELSVWAHPTNTSSHWMSYVYVYVDGVEADKPLSVIVNATEADYLSISGSYAATYLPAHFFTARNLTRQDYARVIDWGFQLQNWTVRQLWEEPGRMLAGITYDPYVYGANCCPILLGDAAVLPEGIPNLGVIFHEMGHNASGHLTLFNCLGIPGAFYQETIAEWYVQFVLDGILSQHAGDLTPAMRSALTALRQDGIDYHQQEYHAYLNRGCPFEYEPTPNGSHPLVHLIFSYCALSRWDRIRTFLEHFQHDLVPEYARILAAHGGIASVENRVTVMAASLSSTFETDVRPDFARLNFPVRTALFEDLMNLFMERVAPPVTDGTEGFENGFSVAGWQHGGDLPWFVTSSQKYAGLHSARAGAIGSGQTSTLKITRPCSAGNLSFYFKTSTESADKLVFKVNGQQKAAWSGPANWKKATLALAPGTYTFEWNYVKNATLSAAQDTVWIDDVVFP